MLIKDGLVLSNIIVKKYSIIWENIHIFSSMFTYIIFILYNIIYIYHFTNVFTQVIEHFPNVLLMVIVNVSHNLFFFSVFFKVILKIFCVCRAFSSFLWLVFLVPFMLTLHLCCERYLRSLDHVIKKEWET